MGTATSILPCSFPATPGTDVEAAKAMMDREAFMTEKMEKAKAALKCSSLWVMENSSLLKPGAAGVLGSCDLSAPPFPCGVICSPLPRAPQSPSLQAGMELPLSMTRDCRAP